MSECHFLLLLTTHLTRKLTRNLDAEGGLILSLDNPLDLPAEI